MGRRFLGRQLVIFACLATATSALSDESAPKSGSPKVAPTGSTGGSPLREVQPPIFWIPTGPNQPLVPLPNFTYDDFRKLWDWQRGIERQVRKPEFTLQQMDVTGSVTAAAPDRAKVSVTLQLVVHTTELVGVPLRLDSAILLEPPKHQGPGKVFVEMDPKGSGHVAWIRGEMDKPMTLKMNLLVPVSVMSGGNRRMKLEAPFSGQSKLALTVPLRATGELADGRLLDETQQGDKETRFTVRGLGGDFQLNWRPTRKNRPRIRPVLEVRGSIAVTIEGRTVKSTATLNVESSGGPFGSFRVRLPLGATLLETAEQPYEVSEVDPQKRIYQVTLAQPTKQTVVVFSTGQQTQSVDQMIALADFEVLGAARQGGFLAVRVVGDTRILWGDRQNVVRIDVAQLPEGRFDKKTVFAAFEYFGSPLKLMAKIGTKQQSVRIEPRYVYDVDGKEVQLTATLRHRVRGGKVFQIAVKLPKWEDIEVGQGAEIVDDGQGGDDVVRIRFQEGMTGKFETTLTARRPLTVASDPQLPSVIRGRIQWNLPVVVGPMVDNTVVKIAPAEVAVFPADDIELSDESLTNLKRQTSSTSAQQLRPGKAPRQQPPWIFLADGQQASFDAQFQVFEQEVAVDVISKLTLHDDGNGWVVQELRYRVRREGLARINLDVPRELEVNDVVTVSVGGQQHALQRDGEASVSAGDTVPMFVQFPNAKIGSFVVECRYSLPQTVLAPGSQSQIHIPLIAPAPPRGDPEADEKPTTNRLTVWTNEELTVVAGKAPWKLVDEIAPSRPTPAGRNLESELRTHGATIMISSGARAHIDLTTIERAWIQTQMIGSARKDRVVYRFRTRARQFEASLPTGLQRDHLIVSLSHVQAGQRMTHRDFRFTLDDQANLTVPLEPDTATPREYILELFYHFADRGFGNGSGAGAMTLAAPRVAEDYLVQNTVWQLVLPDNEHLLLDPDGFTPEFNWGWQGLYWGRQPIQEQAHLESWSGGQVRDAVPERTNRYVLSQAVGPAATLVVHTAHRAWIVFWASLAVLLAGLVLIYLPAVRQPGAILGVVVVLLALGWFAPEPALLLAQAASAGLILALSATGLSRLMGREDSPPAAVEESPSDTADLPATVVQPTPSVEIDSQDITATVSSPLNSPDSSLH